MKSEEAVMQATDGCPNLVVVVACSGTAFSVVRDEFTKLKNTQLGGYIQDCLHPGRTTWHTAASTCS
jgi:hypothetical protein